MLNGELLYAYILEVKLFAFAYRLFHEDFSPIYGAESMCIWQFIFKKFINSDDNLFKVDKIDLIEYIY